MGLSMFIKTALALLLTVGVAGGAVYYGTSSPQDQGNEVALAPKPNVQDQTPIPQNNKIKPVEGTEPKQPEPLLEPVTKPLPEPELDLMQVMPMLMAQVEKISTVEIKDQAYLDWILSVFLLASASLNSLMQPC